MKQLSQRRLERPGRKPTSGTATHENLQKEGVMGEVPPKGLNIRVRVVILIGGQGFLNQVVYMTPQPQTNIPS